MKHLKKTFFRLSEGQDSNATNSTDNISMETVYSTTKIDSDLERRTDTCIYGWELGKILYVEKKSLIGNFRKSGFSDNQDSNALNKVNGFELEFSYASVVI